MASGDRLEIAWKYAACAGLLGGGLGFEGVAIAWSVGFVVCVLKD